MRPFSNTDYSNITLTIIKIPFARKKKVPESQRPDSAYRQRLAAGERYYLLPNPVASSPRKSARTREHCPREPDLKIDLVFLRS